MPIYEYQCGSCGHHLEALQKFSDEPLKECPECHETALNKLISATSFQLKGTGWYATDTRDKGKAPAKPAEAGEPGAGGSGNASASDKKTGDSSGSGSANSSSTASSSSSTSNSSDSKTG